MFSYSFDSILHHCIYCCCKLCILFLCNVLIVMLCILIVTLCILTVMFMYSYCYVCAVLGILFHCVVLCIVCMSMCAVLLPPGVKQIAVNRYIISIGRRVYSVGFNYEYAA